MLLKDNFKHVYILLSLFLVCVSLASATSTFDTNTTLTKEPKVVGGQPIAITDAPYQVSVRLKARERRAYGSGHICGGSVVSQRLVSTAAHCIFSGSPPVARGAGEYTLVMGSASLYTRDANTLIYDVQQIITHASYNSSTLMNDIALMFINGYIPWQWPTVRAIQLQTQAQAANTLCAVTGWGKMSDGNIAAMLMVGYVPIVSRAQCSLGYGELPNSMLCAGYLQGGIDACQGDSGGPFTCNGLLTGIVSWGSGCGLAGYPGVYTNVTYYNDWVIYQNSTLNYTDYRGGSVALAGSSQLFVLTSAICTIVLSFILSV